MYGWVREMKKGNRYALKTPFPKVKGMKMRGRKKRKREEFSAQREEEDGLKEKTKSSDLHFCEYVYSYPYIRTSLFPLQTHQSVVSLMGGRTCKLDMYLTYVHIFR